MNEIFDKAPELLDKIIKLGQKKAEVLASISSAKETNLSYEQNAYNNSSTGYTSQLKIKTINGKKFGYATTNDLSRWEECVETALKMMKFSPALASAPILSPVLKTKKTSFVDKRIFRLNFKKIDNYARNAVEFCTGKTLDVPQLSITSAVEQTDFANSNNQRCSHETSLMSFFLECVSGEATGSDGHVSTKFFNPSQYVKTASDICINSKNPKQIKTMKADLILDYFAVSGLLSNVFMSSFYADKFQNKKSFLTGKLGHELFSEKLTVVDNGILDNGLISSPFDAEGTPTQKTVLVKKGVVKNLLYDNYTSNIDNKKSTGNCGDLGRTPCISGTNFCIAPGNLSRDELVQSSKKGVIARYVMGGHVINDITGDVSVGLSNAFFIENGKIVHPIKQVMVSFNLFEELKKIDELGKTLRQESNIMAPMIKFSNVQFIS